MVSESQHKRIRTLRACDQCRKSRTKCDGSQPCRRCNGLSKSCQYLLLTKKRGRGSELYSKKKGEAVEDIEDSTSLGGIEGNGTDSIDINGMDGIDGIENINDIDGLDGIDGIDGIDVIDDLATPNTHPHLIPPLTDSNFNSPRWLNINTLFPTELFISSHSPKRSSTSPTYPAFLPILPQLDFIHPQLIDDLIEVYFSNTVYGIAPIIRKSSLLSIANPRQCSPALLFSFLLISAHATDHPLIKATASTRENITSRLSDLVISHMKPLHSGGDLDDVITYIHLGILASMSEFKNAAMKWWHCAIDLARLLKLNFESPSLNEERREEQRRAWWLLFLTDRHLCLCYNLSPSTLDSECTELYLPVDEKYWSSDEPLSPAESDDSRHRGPIFEIYDSGLFGMYLPLMTILGGILDIHFLQFNKTLEISDDILALLRNNLTTKINAFERSIDTFNPQITNGVYIQAWKEYSRCLVHIFHILIQGHMDPIDLLNSIDNLITTNNFETCIDHSIAAAKSIEIILLFDPDLRLIPYFFGIQLLQAGFILLCLADKFGTDTKTDIREACEILVRGHEVCIVTLNTEYQRNFRSILRSAIRPSLPGMDGITLELQELRNRRREVLGLYRWSNGGTGLAI